MNLTHTITIDPQPLIILLAIAAAFCALLKAWDFVLFWMRSRMWAKDDDSDWSRMVAGLSGLDSDRTFVHRYRDGNGKGHKGSD